MSQSTEKSKKNEEIKAPVTDAPVIETMVETNDSGSIRISEDVISAIVKKYTLGVAGVIRFASGNFIVDGLADIIRRGSHKSSISVDLQGKTVKISVTVILEFGVKIPEVAQNIQDTIRKRVEELTGQLVEKVDVIVQSLADKPDPEAEPEEAVLEDLIS